jgi:periplasmic divalent cation tolerance protein
MGDTSEYRVVLTTTDSASAAERLAGELVGRGLAACVNIVGPVRSIYRWEGRIVRDEERLLVIKSSAAKLPALEAALAELHHYDVPELLALKVEEGGPAYLDWLASCLDDG